MKQAVIQFHIEARHFFSGKKNNDTDDGCPKGKGGDKFRRKSKYLIHSIEEGEKSIL